MPGAMGCRCGVWAVSTPIVTATALVEDDILATCHGRRLHHCGSAGTQGNPYILTILKSVVSNLALFPIWWIGAPRL